MTTMKREPYLDFLRAVSLVVVVLWHWGFTILHWAPNGPQPTSPLGYLRGLWILTWLLQVLPVFFYVGGCVHLSSWQRARAEGQRRRDYLWVHLKQLVVPAAGLILVWVAIGLVFSRAFGVPWIGNAVLLILSPLWFLAVYAVLLLLLPALAWLHERFDLLVPVCLGGVALLVDLVRLRYGWGQASWINLAAVWTLAYQAGFFRARIAAARPRVSVAILLTGLFLLVGLVFSGLYPGSMVGVPGERLSNMSPPTFAIVALLVFQIGVCETLRPAAERMLARPRVRRANAFFARYALPLFLFHASGMAVARGIGYLIDGGQLTDDRGPDWIWWAERPLAVLGPLLVTVVLIALFGRRLALHPVTGGGQPAGGGHPAK
ncbi:acyltransferase family protein [Amycolatopsis benzoatilytica]|uniref:acyltransferase family protein n=1 Tax=Amycolatopsis benzoatilytica TaxID=346045 RepID=UPI00036D0565|nr:acyltransferase family protein [Amycolatopsis benzoatilytica]